MQVGKVREGPTALIDVPGRWPEQGLLQSGIIPAFR
jgi:hypothetical protein